MILFLDVEQHYWNRDFLKWKVYASDLNPLSFVFTKAKSHTLDKNQIIKTITKYEQMYRTYKVKIDQKDFNYMKTYFSKNVYKQICFLKEILRKKWNVLDNTNTWLLGYEKDNLKKEIKLDDHHGLADYKEFLINFMNCAFNVLKRNEIDYMTLKQSRLCWMVEYHIFLIKKKIISNSCCATKVARNKWSNDKKSWKETSRK